MIKSIDHRSDLDTMELSPVLSKLFPVPPGSQTPPQIPRAQYGYPVPPALRPHAGPPPGITFPNALSMLMLRSNHAAHVSGSVHAQRKTSNNFEIHPLHPEIRHVVPPSDPVKPHADEVRRKKRNQHNKSRGAHRQAANNSMTATAATAPITPSQIVVSSTNAPGGGTIVSSRDEKGQIHVRVEYDRNQILRSAHSPYSLLPPACLKNIVMNTSEILSRFPQRHGINLTPSCEVVAS
ncbi:hypothetical protein TELCIR_00876 [Teladorsagia circumcincta]|uniref:Uncharacterized protein n=1 Tax=Teladorsagia circumcincta TaxID=45464 RepID=A0A2G9V3G7_TELCI|nr:hypothetical protein TELCIR_00876 [Teladorsagia circumcincta]